ncbi:MAG: SIS domain-containing protein [Candidatus Dormibacteraeota bacterium]|nr:SIS domain-containing protein [Candidatus Dormibacteraeota bacterium]
MPTPTTRSTFEAEIRQQPDVVAAALAVGRAPIAEAAEAITSRQPAALLIAARGSSDHAATYAKYLFEIRNSLPVVLAAPSVFGLYKGKPNLARFCVLAVSQSGASPDVCSVIEAAREQGSLTIALTNQPKSRLARAAEMVLEMHAGKERSVPASKTYTTSLLALAMLSQAMQPKADFAQALERVPEALRQTIALSSPLQQAAGEMGGTRMAVIGRGYHLATAEELALKITETSYSVADGQSVADFMHGPVAMVEPGFPVLLLEAAGPTLRQMRQLGAALVDKGAHVLAFTDRPGRSGRPLVIKTGLPESLTPLPYAVAGQLLALHRALSLGLDPDHPRGLQKVTQTN